MDTLHDNKRVGLYIQPATRLQLNEVKARLSLAVGRPLSQDETIRHLIRLLEKRQGNTAEHRREFA